MTTNEAAEKAVIAANRLGEAAATLQSAADALAEALADCNLKKAVQAQDAFKRQARVVNDIMCSVNDAEMSLHFAKNG